MDAALALAKQKSGTTVDTVALEYMARTSSVRQWGSLA